MLARKTKDEGKSKGWSWQWILVLGLACAAAYSAFTQQVPKFESLAVSEAVMTRTPYRMERFSKLDRIDRFFNILTGIWRDPDEHERFIYYMLDLDGRPAWIGTGVGSHAIHRALYTTPVGTRIKVWRSVVDGEPYIWHIEHKGQTLLDHGDIVKSDRRQRIFLYAGAIVFFVISLGMLVFKRGGE